MEKSGWTPLLDAFAVDGPEAWRRVAWWRRRGCDVSLTPQKPGRTRWAYVCRLL